LKGGCGWEKTIVYQRGKKNVRKRREVTGCSAAQATILIEFGRDGKEGIMGGEKA